MHTRLRQRFYVIKQRPLRISKGWIFQMTLARWNGIGLQFNSSCINPPIGTQNVQELRINKFPRVLKGCMNAGFPRRQKRPFRKHAYPVSCIDRIDI